jgi:adenosylcobinamide kinase/adenosylcobinamide-phosphate guanylyltransferase
VHVILVTNEVGMGLVPEYPLGRHFRDALGRLNQAVAAVCGEVYLIVAGLPLRLK